MRLLLLFAAAASLEAAPTLQQLQYEISNHEAEITMFQQRLSNQEATLELLREEIQAKGKTPDSRIHQLAAEIVQMKEAVGKSESRLSKLEQTLTQQDQNLGNMQAALNAVLEALEIKVTDVYEVRSGDSLEKIARRHKMSLKQLKELNNLKSDRIHVGQKLRVSASA